MKYLLSAAAIGVALVIAAPVWAASSVHHHVTHHRGHHHVSHHQGVGYSDNIANQLNAQEAARSGARGMMGSPGPYGQPSPTQGMPGAWQASASSHPPIKYGLH